MKKFVLTLLGLGVFLVIILVLNMEPPMPTVSVDSKKMEVVQGSYCWNKLVNATCVDKISPPELLAHHQIVPTVVSPQSAIKVEFQKQPIEEIVVEEWSNSNANKVVSVEGNIFLASQEKGSYIYMISGRWHKGSASYIVNIDVK
ncbi:hypothetical protein [Lysinibacillus piscis]|uniref:Uncharacterized protein n=1 Tax=Lysinibacillus piscis TaxID=2518931 RepID=A0ABQ5NEW4_9BACI|nr:hypothetical protein [Lysinibacillus sp. KH24]GLC86935.1 hypothetical protein LYSBPC_00620 [Lysinibacillus sp. KH24]